MSNDYLEIVKEFQGIPYSFLLYNPLFLKEVRSDPAAWNKVNKEAI